MVVCNNAELANTLRRLRSHGISNDQTALHARPADEIWNYQQLQLGFNYRMTELQAALGLSQLKQLNAFVTGFFCFALSSPIGSSITRWGRCLICMCAGPKRAEIGKIGCGCTRVSPGVFGGCFTTLGATAIWRSKTWSTICPATSRIWAKGLTPAVW